MGAEFAALDIAWAASASSGWGLQVTRRIPIGYCPPVGAGPGAVMQGRRLRVSPCPVSPPAGIRAMGGGPAPVPAQGVSPFAGPVMGQAKGAPDLIQHLQAGHDPAADEQGFGDQKGNCR